MQRNGWTGCVILMAMSGLAATPPAVSAGEVKIGYVNLAKIFDEYQRTKESNQVLEQKGQRKQTELEGRANELKKMRDGLDLLNDQAKQTKTKELEEKSDDFQQLKTKTQRELLRERNVIAKGILDEIEQGIQDYAKTNGFSVILDGRSLVYGQDAFDVTDEVAKLLNDRYASKKSAAKP